MDRDLADFLAPPSDADNPVISAVVEDVHANGTVDLSFSGGLAFDVPVLGWYTPATGDVVRVLRPSRTQFLVLGTTRVSNPATVRVAASRTMSWTVEAAPAAPDPVDNPSGLVSPFVVSAESSGAYRSADAWANRSDLYQGAFNTSLGYYTGCSFYGTKPQSAKGVTVTRCRIQMRRQQSSHGTTAPAYLYVFPHAHTSRPSGAPVLRTDAINGVRGPIRVGPLSRGEASTLPGFDLPKQWGQALVDGLVKGFAIRRDVTGLENYVILDGRASYADSGRLSIEFA